MKINLEIRRIKPKEFNKAIKILDNELGKKRIRSKNYLSKKFKKFPEFFIGIFFDKKIVGVIGGFPREDYLLMSELAVDSKFQGKSFGKKLVEQFEKIAKERYNQIRVGAEDKVLGFYFALGYKPFLLIQFKPKDYSYEDFNKFKIIRKYEFNKYKTIETKITKYNLGLLNKLRKKYPKAYFQYIFTKKIK